MKVETFLQHIKNIGIDTVIGVPDSLLKQFCDYLNTNVSADFKHYIAPNEGSAVGIAVGTYLASGRPTCVYMQNSGIGNIVNPLTSIANAEVYGIPMLFVVGWRGEPEHHDEPQHRFMGRITPSIFDVLEVAHSIVSPDTTSEELKDIMAKAKAALSANLQYALIVRKDTFDKREGGNYHNDNTLGREESLAEILRFLEPKDIVVTTTGKISREVYELSDALFGHHKQSFLTVGGMGHAVMIAFGIAAAKPESRVVCLDGDGAVAMHMGALAFIGTQKPKNLIHFCLNNKAHESVGGMPTASPSVSYARVAEACGYLHTFRVDAPESLRQALKSLKEIQQTAFVEVKVSLGSRENLGRPKETAPENKAEFMQYHQ